MLGDSTLGRFAEASLGLEADDSAGCNRLAGGEGAADASMKLN